MSRAARCRRRPDRRMTSRDASRPRATKGRGPGALDRLVRLVQSMRERQRGAAQAQRKGILRCQPACFLRELAGANEILAGRRAEMVSRTLPPAPRGERLFDSPYLGASSCARPRSSRAALHCFGVTIKAAGKARQVRHTASSLRSSASLGGPGLSRLSVSDGSSPKCSRYWMAKRPSSTKPAGCRDLGDVRRAAGVEQALTRKRQPRSTDPAERRRAEICPEMRFERTRPNACDRRQGLEPYRLVQITLEPAKRAHQIARQRLAGFRELLLGTMRVGRRAHAHR